MGPKSALRLMRTLGSSLASLAQSTWSLLSTALMGVGLHQFVFNALSNGQKRVELSNSETCLT
ncbi:hypothetical protein HKD37_16G045247 [Glycine soja]